MTVAAYVEQLGTEMAKPSVKHGVAVEESSFEILRILDGYEYFIAKSSRSRYVQPKES